MAILKQDLKGKGLTLNRNFLSFKFSIEAMSGIAFTKKCKILWSYSLPIHKDLHHVSLI